jgi:hypothetical protein
LQELCQVAFEGKAHEQMEKTWTAQKLFKVARIAKATDMDSTFNPTAVGALRACEGDLGKGEVGLLCGASSTRRRQQRVHALALKLGWSHSPEVLAGEGWSWGCDEGTFTRGINLCAKLVCHDLRREGVAEDDPWLVCLTGDAARVTQRGTIITTCGAKEVDGRLPSQMGTGKIMNQSRKLRTPVLAGYASGTTLMPLFHEMIATFKEIEERGYCEVDGIQRKAPIKVVVVADILFVWKCTGRGRASGSGSFCWTCKVCACTCVRASSTAHLNTHPPPLPPTPR